MKSGIWFSLALVAFVQVHAAECVEFKQAILNAALLFSHD